MEKEYIKNIAVLLINTMIKVSAETADSIISNQVITKIENIEGVNLSLDYYKVLYDVESKPIYLLIDFDTGYAIVS